MGIGHFRDPQGVTLYAEPYDGMETDPEQWQYAVAWADFREDVLSCLSPAWQLCDAWDRETGARIIAFSGLHEITMREDSGGYGYGYVTIRPRKDHAEHPYCEESARLHRLAVASLGRTEQAFFRRLSELWPLRAGHGYTSSAWKPAEKPAQYEALRVAI